MASNEYHFITHWRVPGTVAEVAEILGDALDLPRWWPAVYLGVQELAPGDERGLGRDIDLYTKGWLPYTLHWQFTVTEVRPDGFSLTARGDFDGRGVWMFKQEGDDVSVIYDWKLAANKPLLRRLSFLMKPIFAANHRWAMAKGEESLRLELARRHAAAVGEGAEARATIPPPPGSSSVKPAAFVGAAITGSVGLVALTLLRRRGTRPSGRPPAPH